MTVTTPTVWYANYGNGSSTGYFAITAWHTSWTPAVGTITRATAPTIANERCFICIVSGAVGGTEPSWVNTAGAKTTDGSATWMECTGHPALNADLGSTPLSSANRSGAQVLGNLIKNNAATHLFICTTAGTTGAGEPTYTTTTGGTTTDSGCTWTCLGAVGSFTTTWGSPYSRLNNAGANSKVPAGGTLYVSSAHAETSSSNATLGSFGSATLTTQVICVANAGSFPPVAADITTGASFSTTGATSINMTGTNVEYNGFTFSGGTSATSLTVNSNGGGAFIRLRNCAISCPSTSGRVTLTNSVELINTTFAFGNNAAGQTVNFGGCCIWRDTPNAISTTTAWPTTLFAGSGGNGTVLIEGVDLSTFAGTQLFSINTVNQRVVLSHCKLPAVTHYSSGAPTIPNTVIDFIDCDTAGATYGSERLGFGYAQQISTTVVASGGASDGTTPYSWMFQGAGTTLSWQTPFESTPIVIWNSVTGTNRVITFECAYVGTSLPYNDQIWFDALYFGTSGSTNSSRATSTKATILSTNTQWGSSSTLWGTAAAARSNSHAYVLGNMIGVSSSGSVTRAFVCTTSGTSSGSLPGGYATAVDGTQITDGTAVFTAVMRFTMTVTLSTPQPQAAGYISCVIKAVLNNSSSYPTFFVDPNPVLS
jgi:hypothetical protein